MHGWNRKVWGFDCDPITTIMASSCCDHCRAKSLEYSTSCVSDYGSREYIPEIHQTSWSKYDY